MKKAMFLIMRWDGLNHKNLYNPQFFSPIMPAQDTSQIKEKILSTLRIRGPCLPVHIANATGLSILFASAFLSELFAEKKIKISNMKVGSSPVYFIPEQFDRLEKYAEHLKSKEKDAYLLLKEKKFLVDIEQEPAIRVALRAIKDFAIPFEKNNQLIWRYFTQDQSEYEPLKPKKEEPEKQKEATPEKREEKRIEKIVEKPQSAKKEYPKIKHPKKIASKKRKITPNSQSKQDKFFNVVKDYLNQKGIEITDIIGFSKSDITLKVKDSTEKLLIAYNKKKITEKDILNAHKKSLETNLPYIIFALGEQTKKITTLIDAIKSMDSLKTAE